MNGLNPQDRQILEELMATGAMNPSQAGNMPPMPQQAPQMPEGAPFGAALQGIQSAAPTGGMTPINQHGPPPDMATPADQRIGVGPAQLGAMQSMQNDPLAQQLMQQKPVPGGDPNADLLSPVRAPVYGGMPAPGGPYQAPLPEQLAMLRGR